MNKKEYEQYLQSDHWKKLRTRKRASVCKVGGKPRCGICATPENVQTHHLQYRNIYDVLISDLRILCDQCHEVAHQLISQGKIPTSGNHQSLWALTKTYVKKARGFGNRNLFWPDEKGETPVE